MFNPTQTVIEAFIHELRAMYDRTYGTLEPGLLGAVKGRFDKNGLADLKFVGRHGAPPRKSVI